MTLEQQDKVPVFGQDSGGTFRRVNNSSEHYFVFNKVEGTIRVCSGREALVEYYFSYKNNEFNERCVVIQGGDLVTIEPNILVRTKDDTA